ncbi:MAG: hypothetical protein HY690_13900 [Chloroflexi bacterium]|nr:hypothetical protein [Chloroflexota bacterium]
MLAAILAGLLALAGAPLALAAVGLWSQLGLAGLRVGALAVHPSDHRVLLAGTDGQTGQGVFRSQDAGAAFTGQNLGLQNFTIRDLAFDPADPNIAFAATGRSGAIDEVAGVHRSADGGRTWNLVLRGFAAAIAIDPSNPNLVYAGGAPPIRKSTDRGLTWFDPQTGSRIQNVDILGVAVNPTTPSLLLAGGVTEGGSGGVFRSTDGGANWQQVLALTDGVNDVTFASATVAFLGAGTVGQDAGVWRSQDGGLTWQRTTADEFGNVVVHDVLANPLNAQTIYAGTSGRGVIRSTDGGDRWLELNPELGTVTVLSLAIDRAAPQTLFAGTDSGIWAFTIAEPQFTAPTVILAPSRALPGEAIRVRAEAFTQAAGTTQCIGIRGPAQNIGLGLAPAFNLNLATIAISGSGQGENVASVPSNLPPGPFEIVVGGCELQRGIAPLAGASAQLSVGATTLFFAEGSTQAGFDTWILLQNPSSQPTTATLTLIDDRGAARAFVRQLAPTSRTSILLDDLLPGVAVSTRVDASRQVFAERAMFFGPDGHVSAALPAPARRWFLAEGSSQGDFKTWIQVQNPGPQAAQVTFTFQLENGSMVTHQEVVAATSRFTLLANQFVPAAGFSTLVESSVPVVVERAMFVGPIGAPVGGHGAPAATTPSTLWLFGEGSSQPSVPGVAFNTFVLLQNPNPRPVGATLRFLRDDGTVLDLPLTLAANARTTISANLLLANEAFGIRVEAQEPIVAERSMFFGPQAVATHDTLGAVAPSVRWQLAEGSTAAPFETWILVANPNGQPTNITLTFSTETGQVVEFPARVGANTRATFLANLLVPNTPGLSTRVDSELPVVVERSMYFNGRRGGTNTIGIVPS